MAAKSPNKMLQAMLNVSRETIERLQKLETCLATWNRKINLVSATTLDQYWVRHVSDSAQLWDLRPPGAQTWVDIGSGAGFPGLVIAALAAEQSPELTVSLIESDRRKAAFLHHASQEMNLSPRIRAERAEDLASFGVDVVSARAVAPLAKLIGYMHHHGKSPTVGLFPKGRTVESELTEARKYWTFEVQKTPSTTDSGGVIVQIRDIRRV